MTPYVDGRILGRFFMTWRQLALLLSLSAVFQAWTADHANAEQRPAASLQEQYKRQSARQNDYAQSWEAYGEAGRTAYVQGFMEGHMNGVLDAADFFDGKTDSQIVNRYRDTTWDFAGITVGVLAKMS